MKQGGNDHQAQNEDLAHWIAPGGAIQNEKADEEGQMLAQLHEQSGGCGAWNLGEVRGELDSHNSAS
jgi:hypothetical protein